VIYSILIFSGVVIVTTYAGLAKEVTITFVGTRRRFGDIEIPCYIRRYRSRSAPASRAQSQD
jgi:hypothetical protein